MEEEDSKKPTPVDSKAPKDKFQTYASLAFMIVVVVIGLPMWWKSTEIYRVSLPYSAINNLNAADFKISTNIGIFTFNSSLSKLLVNDLREKFSNEDMWEINFTPIPEIPEAINAKTPAGLENLILSKFPLKSGDFLFFEWQKLKDEILLTSERSALITEKTDLQSIERLIRENILQIREIKSILTETSKVKSNLNQQISSEILISILNSNPHLFNIEWNVKKSAGDYLTPYLQQVEKLANFTLKSQWRQKQTGSLPFKELREDNKIGKHFIITKDSLPYLITSIENNLGSSVTEKEIVHIIVYVPSCDNAPLYIFNNRNDNPFATGANVETFVSPKWGGIVIHNPPKEICRLSPSVNDQNFQRANFKLDSQHVMQNILLVFQKLINLNTEINIDGVKMVDLDHIAPRTWQYESNIRKVTINHVWTAIQTLQSLTRLLDNINYIVINDDVGQAINNAHDKILQAETHIANGDLLEASKCANEAFESSEKAFFDASLLAQLYFPDEQKYAIYIPLFLPVMVPVISSVFSMWKYFFE